MEDIDWPPPWCGEFRPRIPVPRNIAAENAKATILNRVTALVCAAEVVLVTDMRRANKCANIRDTSIIIGIDASNAQYHAGRAEIGTFPISVIERTYIIAMLTTIIGITLSNSTNT
jgi:succinyl-CoA synthetase alpha subunit